MADLVAEIGNGFSLFFMMIIIMIKEVLFTKNKISLWGLKVLFSQFQLLVTVPLNI